MTKIWFYKKLEPPAGIEPTSQDYKSSASPFMLRGQIYFILKLATNMGIEPI